jgi:hypothetical protein
LSRRRSACSATWWISRRRFSHGRTGRRRLCHRDPILGTAECPRQPMLTDFPPKQGNGQWPLGEVANLTVERYDENSVVIRRADPTGAAAGLTAVYTGTRHGTRVGGEFTSSWPGHWDTKSGNWYATVEAPVSRPSVMHFCASNCFTLTWDRGHYVAGPRAAPDWASTWVVDSFTRESVILRRHDSPTSFFPNGWDVVYRGRISPEGISSSA